MVTCLAPTPLIWCASVHDKIKFSVIFVEVVLTNERPHATDQSIAPPLAHRPRAGRVCRRGPDDIARRNRHPAAEASARFDTSELTTGMTAAFTHDDNSHNAASASRLASSSVALSLRASCLLLDSTISHPHCWRDRSVTAGVRHCSSAASTRGRERWHLAVRS
jgi:hypothetical protein